MTGYSFLTVSSTKIEERKGEVKRCREGLHLLQGEVFGFGYSQTVPFQPVDCR
jgi:hypothetical protein